jgi:hypothetical protein
LPSIAELRERWEKLPPKKIAGDLMDINGRTFGFYESVLGNLLAERAALDTVIIFVRKRLAKRSRG